MKILLDESLPRKLKADFGTEYEVRTVHEMGWLGKKNGELLGLMAFNEFDYFITVDRNLAYQQNLDYFSITIFVLVGVNNKRATLQALVDKLKIRIKEGGLKKVNEIT